LKVLHAWKTKPSKPTNVPDNIELLPLLQVESIFDHLKISPFSKGGLGLPAIASLLAQARRAGGFCFGRLVAEIQR